MKKIIAVFAAFAALLCLFACSKKELDENAGTKNAVNAALSALGMNDRGLLFASESDNDADHLDDDLLSGKYGVLLDAPTVDMMESYAVFFAYDSYGTELGVFRMTTPENAAKMKEYIETRQKKLLDNAVNYPDTDTKTVSSLVVRTDGKWVYYIMSDNNDIALPEMEKVLYRQ